MFSDPPLAERCWTTLKCWAATLKCHRKTMSSRRHLDDEQDHRKRQARCHRRQRRTPLPHSHHNSTVLCMWRKFRASHTILSPFYHRDFYFATLHAPQRNGGKPASRPVDDLTKALAQYGSQSFLLAHTKYRKMGWFIPSVIRQTCPPLPLAPCF